MDTCPTTETTAQHLTRLGCTPAQFERHLANLTRLAAIRDSRRERRRPALRRARQQVRLSVEEADAICEQLSQRAYAWFERKAGLPWAGHVVCRLLDRCTNRTKVGSSCACSDAWGVSSGHPAAHRRHLVRVLPRPQERIRLLRRSSTATNGHTNGRNGAAAAPSPGIPLAMPPRNDAEATCRRLEHGELPRGGEREGPPCRASPGGLWAAVVLRVARGLVFTCN